MSRIHTRCAVCGSPHVQYAVWYSPSDDEVRDDFGTWNSGDNTFCSTCDEEDRDPNPNLVSKYAEPEPFADAEKKWHERNDPEQRVSP